LLSIIFNKKNLTALHLFVAFSYNSSAAASLLTVFYHFEQTAAIIGFVKTSQTPSLPTTRALCDEFFTVCIISKI